MHPAARGEALVQKRAGRVCMEACAFLTKLLSSAHGADKADFGLGFQVKVLKPFSVVPASLGSENQKRPWQLNRSHQNQRAGGGADAGAQRLKFGSLFVHSMSIRPRFNSIRGGKPVY